ncbi:Exoskeleton protein RP43 [Lamellibrachia satsuma]|nr:Exoskeleton protein RP43 [Lamellibrachia satsuma]
MRRFDHIAATCKHFEHCEQCPIPAVQCVTCDIGSVMPPNTKICLACPTKCATTSSCRYNDETKQAECSESKCPDGYVVTDGRTTCTECSGTPTTLTGTSGLFGVNEAQHKNSMSCSWKIQVEAPKRLELEFLTFDVESSISCVDSVKVYDGEDNSAPLLGTFCGTSLPGDVISSKPSLFVSFNSDSSVTRGGFKIKYTATISRKYHS